MRSLHQLFCASVSFAALAAFALASEPAGGSVAPAEALARLKSGNAHFVSEPVSAGQPTAAARAATARSQHPFAIIVGCADSRTAPELVFDQNIGDLFVIRTAGNLVDPYALGSIEYAVEHLGTRLIVVLGHQRCGAVSAAIAAPDAPPHIGSLVRALQPAVQAARGMPGDLLTNAIKVNAAMVAAKIKREAHFGPAAPEVRVVSAYYDLDTGRVEWTKNN